MFKQIFLTGEVTTEKSSLIYSVWWCLSFMVVLPIMKYISAWLLRKTVYLFTMLMLWIYLN